MGTGPDATRSPARVWSGLLVQEAVWVGLLYAESSAALKEFCVVIK